MNCLQFAFLVLISITFSCAQVFRSIVNNLKSNFLEDGLKIPVSILMLEPYDGEMSVKIPDNSIAAIAPGLRLVNDISSQTSSLPDASALDESFPKIEVSPSTRHYFHKKIRSPCSQQDDSVSNNNDDDDDASNAGETSDNNNSGDDRSSNRISSSNDSNDNNNSNDDTTSNQNNASHDSNRNTDNNNENIQSTSDNNSVNPEDSGNGSNDDTDSVRRSRGSNGPTVGFVTSANNSTDLQEPSRNVHNSDFSSGLSRSVNAGFNGVPESKNHHNLNESDIPEKTLYHKYHHKMNVSDIPEDLHSKSRHNFSENSTSEALTNWAPTSVALLNLPDGSAVYAVPDIDTPARPIVNNKRAVQKPRPLLKKKSLKGAVESSAHSEASDVSSKSVSGSVADERNVLQVDSSENNQNVSEKTSSTHAPRANKYLRKKQAATKPALADAKKSTDDGLSSNALDAGEKPVEGGLPGSNHQNEEPTASLKNSQSSQSSLKDKKMPRKQNHTQEHIPCTCGVFLSGQFTKGTRSEPNGNPIVEHQLGQTFACSTAGKNQCQNKCLDTMVKHLPNSGAIICGSIDRDIYKEKAYLWVKNCHDVWVNTNLSSGKEHCCKDNQPIKCSLMV